MAGLSVVLDFALVSVTAVTERWKSYGARMFQLAMDHNLDNIRTLLTNHLQLSTSSTVPRVLDMGCGDGSNLVRYAPSCGADLFGVDFSGELVAAANERGISVTVCNLEEPLQLSDCSFDAVTSNQVIEHVSDTDHFLAECRRLVRPGGIIVISTENMASWHNIAALMLGWQAFSLTNVSSRASSIGNPLGNLRHAEPLGPGMHHRRIFSLRGLVELMSAHGLTRVEAKGAGYYPLPTAVARIEPRHSAFITVAGVKHS